MVVTYRCDNPRVIRFISGPTNDLSIKYLPRVSRKMGRYIFLALLLDHLLETEDVLLFR